MEAIRNSKESFVRPKQLIWYGGTYIHTYTQTDTQIDPYIELRYAQQKKNFMDMEAHGTLKNHMEPYGSH